MSAAAPADQHRRICTLSLVPMWLALAAVLVVAVVAERVGGPAHVPLHRSEEDGLGLVLLEREYDYSFLDLAPEEDSSGDYYDEDEDEAVYIDLEGDDDYGDEYDDEADYEDDDKAEGAEEDKEDKEEEEAGLSGEQAQATWRLCLKVADNTFDIKIRVSLLKRCVDLDYTALEPRAQLAVALSETGEFEQADVIFSVIVEDAIENEPTIGHTAEQRKSLLNIFCSYMLMLRHWSGRGPAAAAEVFYALKAALPWVTWTDTMQISPGFVPGRRNVPVWDTDTLEYVAPLQVAASGIRTELDQFLQEGLGHFRLQSDHDIVRNGSWTEYVLWQDGHFDVTHCMHFPITCRTVASLTAITGWEAHESKTNYTLAGQVTFMRLAPGTQLKPHTGQLNNRLTVQLPLIVPRGVHIRIANTTHTYTEGRVLVFDDSFEHEVRHDGLPESGDRYVLYLTAHHPDLPVTLTSHNYASELRAVREASSSLDGMRRRIAALEEELAACKAAGDDTTVDTAHEEL